jgi:hypothetical protein
MGFPLSHSKKKLIINRDKTDYISTDIAIENICKMLRKVKATNIISNGHEVSFKVGIFRFVINTNILTPISYGRITVKNSNESLEIHYQLKFIELFVIVTIMVPLFFGSVLVSQKDISFLLIASILCGAWFWLFGMNYLITIWRFPSFVKEAFQPQTQK